MKIFETQTITLETDRIILRKFAPMDYIFSYKNWCKDEDVCRYLTWTPHKSIIETKKVVDSWIESYKKDNFFLWAIVLKETNEPIGSIDFRMQENGTSYTFGYCIAKDYWHQGITSECLIKLMDFMFKRTNCEEIIGKYVPVNACSGMVMRKCGLIYDKNVFEIENGRETEFIIYRLTKEEYESTLKTKK